MAGRVERCTGTDRRSEEEQPKFRRQFTAGLVILFVFFFIQTAPAAASVTVDLLAQIDVANDAGGTGSPADYITALANLGAVSMLAYVSRMLFNGQLVHRDPKNAEAKLLEVVEDLSALVKTERERADTYREAFFTLRNREP